MTILLQISRGSGSSRVVNRCDQTCYNAKHQECACICGGINHGVGKEAALDNLNLNLDRIIRKLERQNASLAWTGEIKQHSLFDSKFSS